MRFEQFYLCCLSQASYLVGDETSGRAAVVDPRRDVGVYLDDAAAAGLRIEHVIETHVHADFLSGHLELAAATGATVIYGAGADVQFPHRTVADGERLELGQVVLEFRATPGHTPESVSIVVWEAADAAAPYGVLTGDTLFIGDVGRPDLLASQGQRPEDMARQLYRSLHSRLLSLPDSTRVYPAHGAGSACGKNLSTATVSTIGEQRRTNYALCLASIDEFVSAVTEGQPPRPDYFARVAEVNREPHGLLADEEPPSLSLDEVFRYQAGAAVVLDVRSPEEFARGHLRGSLNVGLDGRFAEHAGEVVGVGQDVVVVCDPGRGREARVRLSRVGLDSVIGALDRPAEAISERPGVAEVASRLTARELAEARTEIADLVVLDVRDPGERARGCVEGSAHIPIAELRRRIGELDPAVPVVAYCAGGYRSSIAASLLRARAFADVSDLIGGYEAWARMQISGASQRHGEPPRDPEHARGAVPDAGLIVRRAHPLNCETPLSALTGGAVMPTARFYVRNHFSIPDLDGAGWRLCVGGLAERPLSLSLAQLRAMPSASAVVTLECAGNGRAGLYPRTPGEQWEVGAVSTAEWTGVPLTEVLDRAGVRATAQEVVFRGADCGRVHGRGGQVRFERSLPVQRLRQRGALLAYAMNGEDLPVHHGYPLRLVVPGWYAVASVKWLTEIELIDRPFTGYFQVDRYRIGGEPLSLQRVRSLIIEPGPGGPAGPGDMTIRGVAWSGAAPIARVEVRIDDGPWHPARLVGKRRRHAWQWWEHPARLTRPAEVTIRCRATDLAGRTQPDLPQWNPLGYANNAVHTVRLAGRRTVCPTTDGTVCA